MKLNIYMKSGNKITIGGVSSYNIKNQGDNIVGLEIAQRPWMRFFSERLLIKSINLSQIEAVTMQG